MYYQYKYVSLDNYIIYNNTKTKVHQKKNEHSFLTKVNYFPIFLILT